MESSDASPPRPQHVTLIAGSPQVNLTCYGLHVWAEDFLAASRVYAPAARKGSFVQHFLCCQSIELSLKAFLSLRGMSRKKLKRRFGHNVTKLLHEAVQRGLGEFVEITPADVSLIQVANQWYDSPDGKRFQYFDVGDVLRAFKGAPDPSAIETLAERLQAKQLREAVLRA